MSEYHKENILAGLLEVTASLKLLFAISSGVTERINKTHRSYHRFIFE